MRSYQTNSIYLSKPFTLMAAAATLLLSSLSQAQITPEIEKDCIAQLRQGFQSVNYESTPGEAKFIQNTYVVLTNYVPGELETEQFVPRGLYRTPSGPESWNFFFSMKREICAPENGVDLQGLARLQVAEYVSRMKALRKFESQTDLKNKGMMNLPAVPFATLKEQEFNNLMDPAAKSAKQAVDTWAAKKVAYFKEHGRSEPVDGETFAQKLLKRIKESTRSASGTVGVGSCWKNPDPNSVKNCTNFSLNSMIDLLALAFGQDNLPEIAKNRLYVRSASDLSVFGNGNMTTSSITGIELQVGDSYFHVRDNRKSFVHHRDNEEQCDGSTHCKKNRFTSYGFRWNLVDPLKYRSNVYFEYDTVKFDNKDFEAPVIKQTSDKMPHWPYLRRVRTPDRYPGLLLGYMLRVGFIAQVARKVPNFLPFIKNLEGVYGHFELFGDAIGYGSTVFTDSPDSIDLSFGFQIRYPKHYTVGLRYTKSSEVELKDVKFHGERRSLDTVMVFVTIPFVEPDYIDDEVFVPGEYNKPFTVDRANIVYRTYKGDVPLHPNGIEDKIRQKEMGIDVAASYGRSIYEMMLLNASGTDLSNNQSDNYQALMLNYKYEINPNLRLVLATRVDNFEGTNHDLQVGAEIMPLKGTPAENYVNMTITPLVSVSTDLCATVRCENVRKETPAGLDLTKRWTLHINADKDLEFPWWMGLDKLGVSANIGIFSTTTATTNFELGHWHVGVRGSLLQKRWGFALSVFPFMQAVPFGVGAASPDIGLGHGRTSTNDKPMVELSLDVLRAGREARRLWKGEELQVQEPVNAVTEKKAANILSLAQGQKPSEKIDPKKIVVDINNLPRPETDQSKVVQALFDIMTLWLQGDEASRSPEAEKLRETVPHLVLNIAKKKLYTAKLQLLSGKVETQKVAVSLLEDVRQIYDVKQNYAEIELESDRRLETLFRHILSRSEQWKANIQALSNQIQAESTYCLGVALKKTGNVEQGEKLMNESGYSLPNKVTRSLKSATTDAKYCVAD